MSTDRRRTPGISPRHEHALSQNRFDKLVRDRGGLGALTARQIEDLARQCGVPVPGRNRAVTPGQLTAADIDGLKRPALAALALERRLTVSREDGRNDLEPTASDLVRALIAWSP